MEVNSPDDLIKVQKLCIDKVAQGIELVNKKFGLHLPMPQIRFSATGGVAGRAWIGRNLIEFNTKIIRLNPDAFLLRTPYHEVAHLAAHERHGHEIQSHGNEWRNMAWAMGIDATPCHNYVTDDRDPRRRRTVKETYTEGGLIVKPVSIGKVIEL
jgi:predicted SprT family Zn-dependent metalloprotease